MKEKLDTEIEAIRVVLNALDPLDPDARRSVIDYVLRRLKIELEISSGSNTESSRREPDKKTTTKIEPERSKVMHIKDLKEEKQPKSDIEMCVLTAYYLAEMAPEEVRKPSISKRDIDTYFKIAGFKLPTNSRYTLQNSKNAGYLDSLGSGEFKLNAIGYNLIAHNLPRKKSA